MLPDFTVSARYCIVHRGRRNRDSPCLQTASFLGFGFLADKMQPARTTSPTSKGKRPDTPNLNTNTTERVDTPQTAITPYTALFDRTNSQSLDTPASTAPPSAVEDMEKRLRFAARKCTMLSYRKTVR